MRLAIPAAHSWADVFERLGVRGGGAATAVRVRARSLGVSVIHLDPKPRPSQACFGGAPNLGELRDAGSMMAAVWFVLRGYAVSWPLEPRRYDLLVENGERIYRVQVKTTTYRSGGSSIVSISNSRRSGRCVYTPDEIDYFFVIDGDCDAYLIPYEVVAGVQHISLRRYEHFRVATREQWLPDQDQRPRESS